jgi:hypothetical protein
LELSERVASVVGVLAKEGNEERAAKLAAVVYHAADATIGGSDSLTAGRNKELNGGAFREARVGTEVKGGGEASSAVRRSACGTKIPSKMACNGVASHRACHPEHQTTPDAPAGCLWCFRV